MDAGNYTMQILYDPRNYCQHTTYRRKKISMILSLDIMHHFTIHVSSPRPDLQPFHLPGYPVATTGWRVTY